MPIDWKRVYALPYNHFFEDEIKTIRFSLELPVDGIHEWDKAKAWMDNHIKSSYLPTKDVTDMLADLPLWAREWLDKSLDNIDIKSLPDKERDLLDTKVRLNKWALYLIWTFKLPLRMRDCISFYIVTGDKKWLLHWRGLDIHISTTTEAAALEYSVTISGVNSYTTKQEWIEVWEKVKYEQGILQSVLKVKPTNKRPGRGKELQRRIKRYAEWYHFSVIQGLGPSKAIYQWEAQNQMSGRSKHGEVYDISTVAKAIEEFKSLITPIDPSKEG